MKQSDLQFSNPCIKNIDFRVNDKKIEMNDLPVNIDIKSKVDSSRNIAVVSLILTIGSIDNDNFSTSIYFKGTISAEFKWNNNLNNPEKMLKTNGGAVLLSYIRPILASLTLQAGITPLHLPFVNFTE